MTSSRLNDGAIPRKRFRRSAGLAAVALIACAGLYVATCALVPLPEPVATLRDPEVNTFAVDDAEVQSAVAAQALPTAVGWLDGDDVWTNDDSAHQLASITKLVTVLVGQEAAPLHAGEPGPSYSWTEADVELQAELQEEDGIAFPIPVGTEVTRHEMLTLALIPSANDFATAYAHSIFGDNDGFVAAVRDWSERNGFESLEISEPSGMSEENVASASDVLRISRLVLADPVLSEIVGMERATLPWGIGEVENTNPLLGSMPGVVGVKTGHTEPAGYSLSAAARGDYADRELTRIAVVLGRETEDERSADASSLLTQLAELPARTAVTTSGEHLGTLRSVDGQLAELTAAESFDAVLVPGEEATRTLFVGTDTMRISGPNGDAEVAIRRSGSFNDPSLLWRLSHPRELLLG